MTLLPPVSPRPNTLFPYTTLVRAVFMDARSGAETRRRHLGDMAFGGAPQYHAPPLLGRAKLRPVDVLAARRPIDYDLAQTHAGPGDPVRRDRRGPGTVGRDGRRWGSVGHGWLRLGRSQP